MPIPNTVEIRGPLLEVFKDEAPHNLVISELLELIAGRLDTKLSEMSSTERTAFKNNINDALKYLLKNKLLRHPSKTTYLISKIGSEVLADAPEIIDDDYLKKYKVAKPEKISAPAPVPEPEPEPEPEAQEEEPEIPVGFEEQEQEREAEQIPEISEPQAEAQDSESSLEEIETDQQDSESEIESEESESEETSDESDDVFFGDDEAEDESLEAQAEENQESESEDIAIEEDIKLEEIQSEFETENENEDFDMNETELDATIQAEEEIPEEIEEEINADAEDEDVAQDSSDLSIEEVLRQYNDDLADNVLEKIESLHQDNFCMLVMDLLSKMGYRVFQTARYTNEAEGSDLIQGIILENKPGMNPIYIQARKLSSSKTVSKADMLDFVSALSDKGGKGMFVTTGKFAKSAEQTARDEGIMLVDGKKLSGLMISNNFCVNTEKVFELKAFDAESFDEYAG